MNQEESGVYPRIEGYARDLSWGTHICQLYRSKQDLMDIVVPYIAAGLLNNQRCIWLTSRTLGSEEAHEALRKTVPNLEEYTNKNQIEINPQTICSLFSQGLDLGKIRQEFITQEKLAFDQGFLGLRLAGDVTQIEGSPEPKLWTNLSAYEAAINDHIKSHKIIALCTYPLEKCISTDVPEIESHHTGTLLKGNNRWILLQNINHNKESEAGYRELADSITDSFAALDTNLRYIYWNKTYEKTTGIPAQEVIGKHISEVFKKERGTKKVTNMYLKVLRSQKPLIFVDELVINDKRRVIENHIYPSKTGIAVFTKDITQQKNLQEKLEEYTQRLEELVKIRTEKLKAAERLAAIGETAGMVGHDIRNPLQAIAGELYLAKTEVVTLPDGENKENLTESFTAIGRQLRYINKIVSDLLDYSKPMTPVMEEVDIEKTIKEILLGVAVPDDIKVDVVIKDGFPKLWTDSSYLKRILINLMTNAVQAMPKGGILSVTANWDAQKATLQIQDTGEGISEEAKVKIFKPLFTTKAKGQGLGLAVVKKLTDALNGKIGFQSAVGQGTKFTIEIPLQQRN